MFSRIALFTDAGLPSSYSTLDEPPSPDIPSIRWRSFSSNSLCVFVVWLEIGAGAVCGWGVVFASVWRLVDMAMSNDSVLDVKESLTLGSGPGSAIGLAAEAKFLGLTNKAEAGRVHL